jgi:hypothetical protein
MPIENDFLPFAVGASANVEAQSTWVADPILQAGFASGIANSAQVNKVLRQASIIASMIAQFIVDHSGNAAIDNGTTATLEANLLAAVNAVIAIFCANALGSGGILYTPNFNALEVSGSDLNGASIRVVAGNYGLIFRNDGASFYILLTPSGAQTGTWNGLRPFQLNLATGALAIDGTGAGTTFGGNITATSAVVSGNETVAGKVTAGSLAVSGASTVAGTETVSGLLTAAAGLQVNGSAAVTGAETVGGNLTVAGAALLNGIATIQGMVTCYANLQLVSGTLIANYISGTTFLSPPYGPTPATGNRSTQLATTQMFANEFTCSLAANGWQKLPSGLIMQWGYVPGSSLSPGTSVAVGFPTAFVNIPWSIVVTPDGSINAPGTTAWLAAVNRTHTGFGMYQAPGTEFGSLANHTWFAVGV